MAPGTRLGRYEIIGELGTGGMAISLACLSTALLIKANPYFTVRACVQKGAGGGGVAGGV